MKDSSIYSYDIFDTCLLRTCGNPIFSFDIIANRILGKNSNKTAKRDFALIRKRGEEEARRAIINNEIEDVTINEIYDFCDFSAITSLPKSEIMKMELEVERSLLVPVYNVCKEIESLRKLGRRIFFISDMYLPKAFIISILKSFGIYQSGDGVYISGETRKCKRTGNLFRLIKEEKNLQYSRWIHKGDNKFSDYIIPNRLGIKGIWVKNKFSYYENELICRELDDSTYLNSIVAGLCRAIRLTNKENPYTLFATDFIAPSFVPYVHFLLDDAYKRGIKNLFFLARDGHIFYQIAKVFSDVYPQLSFHYLYVSRKSLYLPGLKDVSYESIASIIPSLNRGTINDLLEILHMDPLYGNNFDGNDIKKQLKNLFNDTKFVSELNEKFNEQREFCLNYFKQEGLTKGNSAIIDLVGTRKCQISINRILEFGGFPKVFGYYFDVMTIRHVGLDYTSLFFQDALSVSKSIFYRGPQAIFEQHFSISGQERTVCYTYNKGNYTPVFEKETDDSDYRKYVSSINSSICCEFARHYLNLCTFDYTLIPKITLSIYSHFCYVPRKEYLIALEQTSITHSKLQSSPLLYKESPFITLLQRKGWWYGVLIYNSSCLYHIFYTILEIFYYLRKKRYLNIRSEY